MTERHWSSHSLQTPSRRSASHPVSLRRRGERGRKVIRSDLAASSRRRRHQPLHATAQFSSASAHGDNGGNQVVVCRPAPPNASPAAALLTSCIRFGTMRSAPARACARHAKRPTGSCNNFLIRRASCRTRFRARISMRRRQHGFKRVPALPNVMCIWRQLAPAAARTFRPRHIGPMLDQSPNNKSRSLARASRTFLIAACNSARWAW